MADSLNHASAAALQGRQHGSWKISEAEETLRSMNGPGLAIYGYPDPLSKALNFLLELLRCGKRAPVAGLWALYLHYHSTIAYCSYKHMISGQNSLETKIRETFSVEQGGLKVHWLIVGSCTVSYDKCGINIMSVHQPIVWLMVVRASFYHWQLSRWKLDQYAESVIVILNILENVGLAGNCILLSLKCNN